MNKGTTPKLIRTTVMLPVDLNLAMRKLAQAGKRPLAWEVRQALEDHVAANADSLKEAA